MTRNQILAAILTALFLIAAFLFFDAITPPASAGANSVSVEVTTTTFEVVETTTTTVDLSFLNTSSTVQAPDPVPEFQDIEPATIEPAADKWDVLAQCETGGDWATNSGNGYGGGLQFAHTSAWSTWLSYGGSDYAPHPWEASREQQIAVAENVLASSGWKAWPGCSSLLGFR